MSPISPLSLMSLPAAAQEHAREGRPLPHASEGGGSPHERRAATLVAVGVMLLSLVAAWFGS